MSISDERQTAKVLLVDDRRDNLLALEAILQGLPVQAVAVESGEAALKQLLTDDFAVILLDAQMPNMDGFETASHIKRREQIEIEEHHHARQQQHRKEPDDPIDRHGHYRFGLFVVGFARDVIRFQQIPAHRPEQK